jgi:hypothetical protein
MASIISTKTSGGGGIAVTGDTSGVMQLASNDGTTAVTIDASQNVGIGTTSPNSAGVDKALTINGSSNSILELNYGETRGGYLYSNSTNLVLSAVNSGFLKFNTADTERMIITNTGLLQFNSGYGSVATAYGCRAWVNFNGTGTVAIRASGNVTSITDNGTGQYTVNFTNTMPDVNYSVVCSGKGSDNNRYTGLLNDPTTSSCSVYGHYHSDNSFQDMSVMCVSVFR